MTPRPRSARILQLRELASAAEEHLAASALPGLEVSYLPTSLVVGVSPADLHSLAAFEEELRAAVRAAHARLAARPGMRALPPPLDVSLVGRPELPQGSPPHLVSAFPEGTRVATWRPTDRDGGRQGAGEVEDQGPWLELVFTAGERKGTATQTVVHLSLGATLSPDRVGGGLESSLLGAAVERGPLPGGAEGLGPFPALAGTAGHIAEHAFDPEALAARAFRFTRAGRPPLVWAPRGAVVVGRRADHAHLVPQRAPSNLSGRHFAILRHTGDAVAVLDLGSTNGTFLDGARLTPYVLHALDLPAVLEIGTEGTLRLEIRGMESSA